MSSSFEQFKEQLDGAITLIKKKKSFVHHSSVVDNLVNEQSLAAIVDTQPLLERCNNVCEKYKSNKPTIRIIHHLACSGGTLISKCISAMPNVYLLSEVHPHTNVGINIDKARYAPSDIISLSKYAGIPKQKELSHKLFKQSIDSVYHHVKELGAKLVLREHTHADFNTKDAIPEKSSLVTLLEEDYDIKSVLTVRNPIDSFASLVRNGWVHFEPNSFDEYCRRLLLLIEQYRPEQIYWYEDFLKTPQEQMKAMADALDLPFDDTFEYIFGMFKVTGDSGRSSDVIGERSRIAPDDIVKESEESKHFKSLQQLDSFHYDVN